MVQGSGQTPKNLSSAELNKNSQKRRILGLLHERGLASAPDLSKLLNISLPTCMILLNDLILDNYIRISGLGESKGGRRPNLYTLCQDSFYVIACDIGRYSASVAIFDGNNQMVTQIESIKTDIDDPDLVEKLFQASNLLINGNDIPVLKVLGVGIGMPGLIDSKAGINFTIKDIRHQTIGKSLKKKFGKVIYVDNDARMHAIGEYVFGAAKDHTDAICIHWSWGLGLGIFVNGQLYSGNNGFAGEFSHIPMVENGELCICGKRGCLETIASSNTVMNRVRNGFRQNEISTLINEFQNRQDSVTPEDVIDFARKGDEFCIAILKEIGEAMGNGLSYIIQLLNPEIIVLSGPLSEARQFVLFPIQQSLNRMCLQKILLNSNVIISDRGNQSALLGISEMVLQRVFSEMKFS